MSCMGGQQLQHLVRGRNGVVKGRRRGSWLDKRGVYATGIFGFETLLCFTYALFFFSFCSASYKSVPHPSLIFRTSHIFLFLYVSTTFLPSLIRSFSLSQYYIIFLFGIMCHLHAHASRHYRSIDRTESSSTICFFIKKIWECYYISSEFTFV